MLATISKHKFQYLMGAILIVVLTLTIPAYRSGVVTSLFNESQQAQVTLNNYGPPGR